MAQQNSTTKVTRRTFLRVVAMTVVGTMLAVFGRAMHSLPLGAEAQETVPRRPRIRVLVAGARGGRAAGLKDVDCIEIAGQASDGVGAARTARAVKPDVVLMDLTQPRKADFAAIEIIKHEHPEARLLVLTSLAGGKRLYSTMRAGAAGYLPEEPTPEELVQAVREVYQGGALLHSLIARKLIREINRPSFLPPQDEPLTVREAEVLVLVARGLSRQEIADRLNMHGRTISTHVGSILTKLHLTARAMG